MDWTNRVRNGWAAMVIVMILFLAAFAVPILGPLRSSGSRTIVAVAVLLVGAGLALLVERSGTQEAASREEADPGSPEA